MVDIEKNYHVSVEGDDETQVQTNASQFQEESKSTSVQVVVVVVDDPFKWSFQKRLLVASVIYLGVLSLTFSSSAYSSSIPQIREEFGISQEVALLGISLFILGFSLSPLVFGPLSLSIGHRWTYILSYGAFTAFSFAAAEAPRGPSLIILRFMAGFFGGSTFNNSLATVGEFTYPQNMNRWSVFFAFAAFGGPGLGPVVSSFVSQRAGWRWNLRVQAIFVAVIFISFILFVPETSKILLNRKNEKVKIQKKEEMKLFLTRTLGPMKHLVDPVVMSICIYLAVLYGILYGLFGVVPYVFEGLRNFTPEQTGLTFISLIVGFSLSSLVMFFPQQWYYNKLARSEAGPSSIVPEDRFQQALWAGALPPVGLFIFAWTSPFDSVPWIAPLIGLALFSMGTGIILTSFIPYLALYGGPEAALVLGASTLTRGGVAAAFPLFVTQMNKAMTVQGANSFLAGLALLLTPLPWIFKWKGAALRKRAAEKRLEKTS